MKPSVCVLWKCVDLMHLAPANPFRIPTAIAKTESHTFRLSHSMIYIFGR